MITLARQVKVPTTAILTIHISNPELAKMVKDAHASMLMNTTPKIKAPLITLNKSVNEVPS